MLLRVVGLGRDSAAFGRTGFSALCQTLNVKGYHGYFGRTTANYMLDGEHIFYIRIRYAGKVLGNKLLCCRYFLKWRQTSNAANHQRWYGGGGGTHAVIIWFWYCFGLGRCLVFGRCLVPVNFFFGEKVSFDNSLISLNVWLRRSIG